MITLTSLGHATALVAVENTRILVDPWLTRRLDRFWERNIMFPDAVWEEIDKGIDYVVLTHHHCDHLHYPSLDLIRARLGADWARETPIVFPAQGIPRPGTSGMGHLPIPLTLRALGYSTFRPVEPGAAFELGSASVQSFKSRVPFPEMSLLVRSGKDSVMMCADAVLHPETWEWLTARPSLRISLGLVPAHTYVPPGVLTERTLRAPYAEAIRRSVLNFDRYWSTLGARLTVPFASGWHVSSTDGDFDWCNAVMYPWTPLQARTRLRDAGLSSELSVPGTVFEVSGGEPAGVSYLPGFANEAEIRAADDEVTLRPTTRIPDFSPEKDTIGVQRDPSDELIERLAVEFIGSEEWNDSLTRGHRFLVTLHGDTGSTTDRIVDPAASRVDQATEAPWGDGPNDIRYVEMTGATLQALFDGDLVYGSSWGLWRSNCNMLASVFHNPKWYKTHLESVIADYGIGNLARTVDSVL